MAYDYKTEEDSRLIRKLLQKVSDLELELQQNHTSFITDTRVAKQVGGTVPDHGTLKNLDQDDHTQYLLVDGTRAMAGNLDMADHVINNVEGISFNLSPSVSPTQGMITYNPDEDTFDGKTSDATIQIGQELHDRGYNKGGSTLINGSVVYPSGFFSDEPIASLAKADSYDTAKHPLAVATTDIAVDGIGKVTTYGDVRDIDTSGLSLGPVYLSDSVEGGMTSIPPVHPSIKYLIGFCQKVHATEGKIFVMQDNQDTLSYYNGSMREQLDFLVTSNNVDTVTGTLQRTGGGDLTMRFSDGYTILDCTSQTIILTHGTNATPQANYIYIPYSTKTLTKSITGWPSEQHIKIAYLLVQSVTGVYTNDGVYINQNWNDADAHVTTGQGHMTHMAHRIRKSGALYESGIDPIGGTSSYFTLSASHSYFLSNVGVGWQMHQQTIQAKSMPTDDCHVVNWDGDAYKSITDLFDIVNDANGDAIGANRYFNLVFWIVVNKGGEYSPLMCNLPNGTYTKQASAEQDTLGYDVLTIPEEFKTDSSTGILICRATFKMSSTWDHIGTVDLRGTTATSVIGGGISGVVLTEFSDSDFAIYNNADITKQIVFDASGLTTGNTRTITMPDKDVIITDALVDLTDVNLTGLSDNDILVYDLASGDWKPETPSSGGTTTLDGLTDTDLTGLADNDILVYDSASGDWKPETPSSGGFTEEEIQDIVGAMFSGNTETRIEATYEDGDGTIDMVVDDMNSNIDFPDNAGDAVWWPMVFKGTYQQNVVYVDKTILNDGDGTNYSLFFELGLPTNLNGKKLYIIQNRVAVNDADLGNYVNAAYLYGTDYNTLSGNLNDAADQGTNLTSIQLRTYDHTNRDMSSYSFVLTQLAMVTSTTALACEISGMECQIYYA